MTRAELEHAIRAACEVSGDTELWIFGSQAILGQYPSAPETLRQSAECDVVPKNRPERADLIDGALGELSRFHRTHGFYVHGLSLEAPTLPQGWKSRVVKVQNENTRYHAGLCVEAHDLAASKLVAFREKDRAFVRTLLAEKLVDGERLVRRIEALDVSDSDAERLAEWVKATARQLGAVGDAES